MQKSTENRWLQPLTSGGEHWLVLTRDGERWSLRFESMPSEKFSVLRQALKRTLAVRANGNLQSFAESGVSETVYLPAGATNSDVLLGGERPLALLKIKLVPEVYFHNLHVLSPFETRYLSETGRSHPVPELGASVPNLQTDLHVHFSGCVRAPDLIRIGVDADVHYPAALLEEAGIRTEKTGLVSLRSLSTELLQVLQRQVTIPIDRQITFLEMERIYRLRTPITKSAAAFMPLCRQIACDYQAMGARYVELSMSNITEAAMLRQVIANMPHIEKVTGVTIRFLAAMSRHDDPEWDLDYCDRLKQLAKCPYITGADFMGHETNSTRAFAHTITNLAEWAHSNRPGYVLRVHAGENPAYPENVRVAIEAVKDFNVQLRIGHGLYGVDARTLEEARRRNVIIEFNLNSNLALNNIQALRDISISTYLNAGVPAVLGTDGYGIYQSSIALELRAALMAGVSQDGIKAMAETEARYLRQHAENEARWTTPVAEFTVPDDLPHKHFTPEVMARSRAAKEQRDARLFERLAALKIPLLDDAGVRALLKGKRCISFAGAWAKSWERISAENQAIVRTETQRLIEKLDPAQFVVVTGGTHFGVEHIVQRCAHERGLVSLGTLVRETPPDSIDANSITHACLVGVTLYDKAAGLYRLMKDHAGLCLFIGGGNIVSDEIQTAYNLRLRYLLMNGPEGASTLHAREQPDRAFKTADEVLAVLNSMQAAAKSTEAYWHLGANPMVDMVLTRNNPRSGEREVMLIQRHADVQTEPGKWALPGGFQHTDAPRGTAWQPGHETERQACIRELREETGIDLSDKIDLLVPVGVFKGEGRDPRDTAEAWSQTSVFAYHCPSDVALRAVAGGDDASDARWVPLNPFPQNLAFDHHKILMLALAALERPQA